MTTPIIKDKDAVYRGMNRAALDAAYNNTNAVADSQVRLQRWHQESQRLQQAAHASLDVAYAPAARTGLDFFSAAGRNRPLFVFIHGGYWQRNSKDIFSFVSAGPVARGVHVATLGYTLAPEATLTQIAGEIHQALDFLADPFNRSRFGYDRIYVGGWSAGGHLTALACAHPAVSGGLSISGIFDLQPISLCYLNDKLQLSEDEIRTLSPVHRLSEKNSDLRLCVGEGELPELRRQSQDYATQAVRHEMPVTLSVLAGHNHYSILDELADPDGHLTGALMELIEHTSRRTEPVPDGPGNDNG